MFRILTLFTLIAFVTEPGKDSREDATNKRCLLESTEKMLSLLRSDEPDAADGAEAELTRNIDSLSDGLLKIALDQGETNERNIFRRTPRDRALAVLKKLDHRKIIRPLLMNICYFDHSIGREASFTGGYPCATMLCDLGPTAAYEIVKYLERPPAKADCSDMAIDLFARVFVTVYSGHGEIEEAKAMLVRARRRAKHSQHIERLDKKVREFLDRKPPPPANPETT